ncbi:hypothetical protein KUTeg_006290 [Tegillarca granosa]|uniref:Uncharacterized protein n=1 Tax=Tegillarca granosa TaxID=220873 RepID=A0ABQ9FHZ1_TEGGR|nr:hypothetical protein KUTeg_006290 [Tegillarca granosa]
MFAEVDNDYIDNLLKSKDSSSKKVFKAVVGDLKRKGFGAVNHFQPIAPNDLKKLYSPDNIALNIDTPYGLQKKVWFDIVFYLCRRGRENLREMTKLTFEVSRHSNGEKYVHQVVDESDKNHRGESIPDDTIGEARMYLWKGILCAPWPHSRHAFQN